MVGLEPMAESRANQRRGEIKRDEMHSHYNIAGLNIGLILVRSMCSIGGRFGLGLRWIQSIGGSNPLVTRTRFFGVYWY